jgi:hypothetical protein
MTFGESLAIISLLENCNRDLSIKNIKKVARALNMKVVDGDELHLKKMIQVRKEIIAKNQEEEPWTN